MLRVDELLEPVARAMGREILASGYVQADETPVGVQTNEKSRANHTAYFGNMDRRAWGLSSTFAEA